MRPARSAYTRGGRRQRQRHHHGGLTDGGLDNDLGTAADNLTATRTFTVVVTDVDDPPTLDAIADPAAINEDAALQTVNLSGISAAPAKRPCWCGRLERQPGAEPHPDGDLHVAERDRVADLHAGGEHLRQRGDHRVGLRRGRHAHAAHFHRRGQ